MSITNPLPKSLEMSSPELANAIIGPASKTFSTRIPKITQANLRSQMERIMDYTPDWNAFCNALMNGPALDIYVNNMWVNPLAVLKLGRVINEGTWIREIGYPMIKGKDYDINAVDVFSSEDPNVLTAYHVQNRRERYKITINRTNLRQALYSDPELGLSSFINQLLVQPLKADNLDEYLYMRQAIVEYDANYPIYNLNVADITTATYADKPEIGVDIAQKMRQTALQFALPHPEFSGAGLNNPVTTSNDIVLFLSPEVQSNLDVSVLAYAFNMSKADPSEFAGRVVTMDPLTMSDGTKVSAIMADRQWLIGADTLVENAQITNPETLGYNSLLHRWEITSASPFRNVVMFSDRAATTETINVGTVTAVTINTADATDLADPVPAGTAVQLTSTLTGTGAFSSAVTWAIVSQSAAQPIKTETYMNQAGEVFIAFDEKPGTVLTVEARSMQSPTVAATVQITVGDPLLVIGAEQAVDGID